MREFTCFLVDDDQDDREIFCAVFELVAPNSICLTAANGQIALETIEGGQVNPDIIFLDLNMPLMNGRQFLQEIRTKNIIQHIPVVVLTTTTDHATQTSVLQLGAKDFVTKPDKFADWEKAISNIVGKFITQF